MCAHEYVIFAYAMHLVLEYFIGKTEHGSSIQLIFNCLNKVLRLILKE